MPEIELDTKLSQNEAAKTKLFSLISENGITAECKNILDANEKFIFSQWKFTSIKNENGNVIFYGKSEAATTIETIFEADDKDTSSIIKTKWQKLAAAYAVCTAYSQAATENITLPINGVSGILCSFSGKKIKLLFLPEKLFDTVCAFHGAENYLEKQTFWISPFKSNKSHVTSDLSARTQNIAFAQSTIAYYALTQTKPFTSENAENFSQDIQDKNFIPLEHKVNGIDKNVANAIDESLSFCGKIFTIDTLSAFRRELGLTENENEVVTPERKNKIPEKEFAEKTEAVYMNKQKLVNTKRKLHKNKIIIVAAIATVFITVTAIFGAYKSNNAKPTTVGLSSVETATLFYKSLHTLDSELLSAVSKGNATKTFSSVIASIYITGKMRSAYGGQDFITPEEWLSSKSPQIETPVYGIINFTLDGKQIPLATIDAPTNEKHAPAISEDGGLPLSKGTKKKHNAKYTVMILDAAADISQSIEYDETVTLTFDGKKWLVTEVIDN